MTARAHRCTFLRRGAFYGMWPAVCANSRRGSLTDTSETSACAQHAGPWPAPAVHRAAGTGDQTLWIAVSRRVFSCRAGRKRSPQKQRTKRHLFPGRNGFRNTLRPERCQGKVAGRLGCEIAQPRRRNRLRPDGQDSGLWKKKAGQKALGVVETLTENAEHGGPLTASDFADLLGAPFICRRSPRPRCAPSRDYDMGHAGSAGPGR